MPYKEAHLLVNCALRYTLSEPLYATFYSGSQLIAHNYRHGGSGWTMAPGAASYVTGELANRMTAKRYSSEEAMCIVGAGVMGKRVR